MGQNQTFFIARMVRLVGISNLFSLNASDYLGSHDNGHTHCHLPPMFPNVNLGLITMVRLIVISHLLPSNAKLDLLSSPTSCLLMPIDVWMKESYATNLGQALKVALSFPFISYRASMV